MADLEMLQPDGTWKKIGTVDPATVKDLGAELFETAIPPRPFTYVPSLPSDGVECFFIEGSEGAPEVGCVHGPQSPENEAIARLWCQSPRILADLTDAAAQLRKLGGEVNAALAARFEATIAAAVGGAE